ncbi:hypothetical protein HK100_009311 [Physocladia obscura]|uniref:FAD/NAD(P)-binding domain-containing protein n=1 Tax=Physocladia obscura TaxID=109957 RepID=A0AAD5T3X5_9FUNG|nr:hypothetical protein HK100_009311 [Physocladia obscura]
MATPTIVIIGGSFAGTKTAKILDAGLKTKADIVLIEERDALYYTIASPRSVTEPGLAEHLWIPYDKLFSNNPRSRVIKARALEVLPGEVKLSNGDSVPFDFAVITTGARVPTPGQTSKLTKAEGLAETNEILTAVKKAASITIVGGGVVGVEIAGEIATDFPGKNVTIIHAGPTLVNRNSLSAKATSLVSQQLAALKVNVKLNTRAVVPEGQNSILPNDASYNLSPATIKTSTGETIESDVQFLCTGIAQPNSELARTLGNVFDKDGYITVESTGQVKGFKNIFSLGDVSNLDTAKLAYSTNSQSTIIGANIISLVEKSGAVLKTYTRMKPGSFAVLSIGRNGGVLQTPIGTFGAWTTKNIKSKELFIGQNWKDLNLTSTYKAK